MPPDSDSLLAQVQQVRAAGVLGQGRSLQLFDYLAQCTAAGRTPKEVEVAVEVFGKQAADLSQDAGVRVHVHNLRRKLDQYYSSAGREQPWLLTLPKGEYRLALLPNPLYAPVADSPAPAPALVLEPGLPGPGPVPVPGSLPGSAGTSVSRLRPRRVVGSVVVAAVLGALLGFGGAWALRTPAASPWSAARQSAFWAPVLSGTRPVLLVIGDYYLFGDTGGDQSMNVTRLIRDFNINSRSDLERYLVSQPQDASRYQDVGLNYLPTSSAYALSDLLPLLAQVKPRLRVMLASDLNPVMMKSSDVIYVGLLSGLGLLQGPAFTGSRYQLGESFDEFIDRGTHQHYVSQAVDYADDHFRRSADAMYLDYGYVSSFTGPTGNRVIVIAGMQDEGLRQAVDFAADAGSLAQLLRPVAGHADLEGLLEVEAMNHLNLSGRLLQASALAQAAKPGR